MVRCVHHIVDELLHRRLLNTFEVVTDAHIKDERFTGIRRLEHRFEKVQGKPGFEVFIPCFKQGKFGRPFGVKALVFGIDTGLFQLRAVKNLDGFSSMKRPPVSRGDDVLRKLRVRASGRADGSGTGFTEDANSFTFTGE